MLKKILYYILPQSAFLSLKQQYMTARKKVYRPLNKDEIRSLLINKMGLTRGDIVFVHSSMDYLNIDFSPNTLLNLLLDIVGEEGTLLFPAWHFNYRAEKYLSNDNIFDVRKSPSAMGLLSELARRNKGAYRSLHPINSIVAIGRYAEELVAEHHTDIYPCGEKSPYYKMMILGAKIIGLGVTTHYISFVHCPEDIMKTGFPFQTRTDTVMSGKVRQVDGTVITLDTLVAHQDIAHRNMPSYFRKYVSPKILYSFRYRGNDFFIADSRKLFQRIDELARAGITIYS
ncbi:MAG: hypothetical protein RIS29_516 [Bacteroidota bacterium]|jgi:aminoglycoside 3-N-acetyltransferase